MKGGNVAYPTIFASFSTLPTPAVRGEVQDHAETLSATLALYGRPVMVMLRNRGR